MIEVPDYSTPNKKKRFVESELRHRLETTTRINPYREMYLGGAYGGRRKEAILSHMDRAEAEFGPLGFVSVVETFTMHELNPYNNYDQLDEEDCDMRIGAALWILEKLKETGKMVEAYRFLPDVSWDMEAWYLPTDFAHPCYSHDLINAVIHVISNRYVRKGDRTVITEGNARRKQPSEAYRKLLALLPESEVEQACETFRSKVWEIVSRFMRGQIYYDREIERTTREMERAQNGPLSAPFANPPKGSPMMGSTSPGLVGLPGDRTGVDSGFDLIARGNELLEKATDYSENFDRYLWMDRRSVRRETGSREVAEAVEGFAIKDPYELCFALFYLLDTGDDTPWLISSGTYLMSYVQRMLPWFVDASDWDDEEWDEWFRGIQYNRNGWMEQGEIEDEIDYYHEMHGDRSLAQLIYEMSRTVIPTGLHPLREDRKRLIAEGMDEDTARKITDAAELLFLYEFQAKQRVGEGFSWDDEDEEERAPAESPGTKPDAPAPKLGGYWGKVMEQPDPRDDEASDHPAKGKSVDVDKLQSELGEARKLIKSLRNALAITRQEAGSERAKYERELKALRMEHRELADLRELVFNREAEEKETQIRREKPAVQINYPYTTKKRTVIFGGHESWLKVIKPMLPDVKFIDVEQYTFSPELIRNADVVWVQSNCISHTQYGRVVKQTRLHGIQLRYFSHASAEKCAEQLVAEDRKR